MAVNLFGKLNKAFVGTDGIADAVDIELDASSFDGNLDDTVVDLQSLAQHVDDLTVVMGTEMASIGALIVDIPNRVNVDTNLNGNHTIRYRVYRHAQVTSLSLFVDEGGLFQVYALDVPTSDGYETATVELENLTTSSERTLTFYLVANSNQVAGAYPVDVNDIEGTDVSMSVTGLDGVNVQETTTELFGIVNNALNTALNSARTITVFNDGFVIDDTNINTYLNKNNIYSAKIDKNVDISLPTDAEISTAGVSYPIIFEITHLGGTMRIPGNNLVRFLIKDGDTANIDTSIGNRKNTAIQRNELIIISKASAGQDWQAVNSLINPMATLLPDGVFEFNSDITIDVDNIATSLLGETVTLGEAFIVSVGGTRFGAEINANDVLVALVNSPSTATDSQDWLLLSNATGSPLDTTIALFHNQITRTGTRFDLSRNVFVNESNVIEQSSQATGTPRNFFYFTSANESPTPTRVFTTSNSPLQFSELVGGTLTLAVQFSISSSSGFLPELNNIVLDYGTIQFTFPLSGVNSENGMAMIDIQIPNQDYSAILNTDCDVILNYTFRGVTVVGSFTIQALHNTLNGTLRQSITNIAQTSASMAETRVNATIANLAHDIESDGSALEAIRDRISPYKNISVTEADVNSLYLDSTGLDNFPSALNLFNQVHTDNPRFTGGDIALYVGTIAGSNYALKNITQDTILSLNDSEATVDLGESLNDGVNTYFIYRVTGLTANDVYEVEKVTTEQVVAWSDDIDNLQDDVDRIDAELEHALLNLSDEVVQVLENELTVTEETLPSIIATDYNKNLGNTSSQTVFYETSPNTPNGGNLSSKPISDTTGNRARRKLVYIPAGETYLNQNYLIAFDGTSNTDLIRYANGVFFAKVFVDSIPAGSTTVNVYPAPPTKVSGNGIWQTVEALTFSNGIPVPEADELFFTRNIPTSSTTLNIAYRGHANGNIFGEATTTLAGVGGTNEVFETVTLNTGGESVTLEIRYYPSTRQIRASITESVNAGLPTVNDVEIILSYTETRTVPAVGATTREVQIEFEHDNAQVFAIKPSSSNTLIIVGDRTEIDTNYSYTTLFGASENGHLIVTSINAEFLDYQDFTPISSTITDLENHSTLPQFGLFTTEYTHATVLNLDTQLTVKDDNNNTVNVGTELVLKSPDDTYYRLSINNAGDLITIKI